MKIGQNLEPWSVHTFTNTSTIKRLMHSCFDNDKFYSCDLIRYSNISLKFSSIIMVVYMSVSKPSTKQLKSPNNLSGFWLTALSCACTGLTRNRTDCAASWSKFHNPHAASLYRQSKGESESEKWKANAKHLQLERMLTAPSSHPALSLHATWSFIFWFSCMDCICPRRTTFNNLLHGDNSLDVDKLNPLVACKCMLNWSFLPFAQNVHSRHGGTRSLVTIIIHTV